MIIDEIKKEYGQQKVFLIQELTTCEDKKALETFAKKNRNRVEKDK